MKSKLAKLPDDSKIFKWLKPFASILGVGLFTYALCLQLFVGFINYGLTDVDSGDGASFDQILSYQISEGRVDNNSTIFSIRKNDSIASISISQEAPKFLAINLNYLSTDELKLKISFQNNSLEVAQDYLTVSQGIRHYKLPDVGSFDTLLLSSLNQEMTKIGANGISTLTQLGINKMAVSASFFTVALYLFTKNWRRFKRFQFLVKTFREIFENFKKFISVNRYGFIGLTLITVSGYGFFVTNFTLSIDEELFWMIKDGSPWVSYGRFGNYFLDRFLTVDSSVIPYFTDFFAVALLLFSAIIFLFAWARERSDLKLKTTQFIIAGGLFLTYPFVNADFMAFSVYNLWLSLAYVLTSFSIILTRSYHKKILSSNSLAIVILMTVAISIYQSFISAYLVFLGILVLQKIIEGDARPLITAWLPPAFLLTTSTLLYYILNSLSQKYIAGGYGYIGALVGWNEDTNPFFTLRVTLESILNIYLGKYGTSGRILTIIAMLFLVSVLISCLRASSFVSALKILASGIFVLLAPFSIVIILGNMLPARSLVGLPLFLSGAWLVIAARVNQTNIKQMFTIIGFILLMFQLQFLNMVFYGDYLRYQNDLHVGRSIVSQIEAEGFDYKEHPIVFLGQRNVDASKLISKINSGGRSFFDDSSQSYRMTYFLRTIGYPIILPSTEDIQKAKSNPPIQVWPKKGSISFDGSVIVIKLSS